MKLKLHKGLLSFLSGLGWMGLAFYIWFFTLQNLGNKINMLFVYSIITAALGAVVVCFVLMAFSMVPPLSKVTPNMAGFLAGVLSMAAIIIILLAFRLPVEFFDKLHPIITFFLAAACTYLLLIPEEEKEEWKL